MEKCPFCELDEKNDRVIKFTKHWKISYNLYPFFDGVKHILVYPKNHILVTKDLSDEELIDYKNVEIILSELFGDEFYFSFIRQSIGNRKVQHMHYHYIQGNPQDITIDGINYLELK